MPATRPRQQGLLRRPGAIMIERTNPADSIKVVKLGCRMHPALAKTAVWYSGKKHSSFMNKHDTIESSTTVCEAVVSEGRK